MNEDHAISSILIIKPGAIGDLLELTPVIRALSTKYPGRPNFASRRHILHCNIVSA